MPSLRSHEPATGALLWEGEHSDLDAEVARASAIWPHWAAQAFTFRIEAIRRFANAVRIKEAALADRIARETGRPLWDAKAETAALLESIEPLIASYSERAGQKRLDGALGSSRAIRHKPHGVLAVITPYSDPALLPTRQIIPALLAGNAVLFKPSERATATGLLLTQLFREAGIHADLLRCVVGDGETGRLLVQHDGIAGVLFAGAVQTGLAINRMLSSRPDRLLALEMGGNNAMVLWDTPDIASAIALVVQSAFQSGGQSCAAGRRLIVKESMADMVIEELRKTTQRLVVDHPHADPAPYMGPAIDLNTADGLTESFLYLMSHGGKPVTHMRRPHGDLPFITPGIIDVTGMVERPDIELFGPILQIVRAPDFDTAIAEANSTRFGRTAALFGGSPEDYDRFWANIRAGTIHWNRPTNLRSVGVPTSGAGLSGNYRPGGTYGADCCAYPVVSAEIGQPRASIGVGLKAMEIVADR